MYKKILMDEKGQINLTEMIIIGAIITFIGAAFLITLTPTIEDTHQGLKSNIKALKGGGM